MGQNGWITNLCVWDPFVPGPPFRMLNGRDDVARPSDVLSENWCLGSLSLNGEELFTTYRYAPLLSVTGCGLERTKLRLVLDRTQASGHWNRVGSQIEYPIGSNPAGGGFAGRNVQR
jgi:hypothetical protein